MAIRFEYGPPPSALGALAYEAGAAEAANKRRREIEQMQMQAAQMRQQQQQAAVGRQFDAWKTQYSHHSSLDKMQRDFKWREEQAEHNRALEKEKFGLQNERKDFEWDRSAVDRREMWDLEDEARTRRDLAQSKRMSDQKIEEFRMRGQENEAAAERDKKSIIEARQYDMLNPEKKQEVLALEKKIQAIDVNKNFMPQPLKDQADPNKASEREDKKKEIQQQIDAIYADRRNNRKDITIEGGESKGRVLVERRVNGKLEKSLNPNATLDEIRKEAGITGVSDKDNPYWEDGKKVYDDVVRDPREEIGYRVVQRGLPGKSPEEEQKVAVAREAAIEKAYKSLVTENDYGDVVLTARGRAIATAQGRSPDKINESKNFDPVVNEHVNDIYKPEKAGPDPGDEAALGGRGGPFSTTGGQPVVGGQPTATTAATTGAGLGGGPAVEAAVKATEAGQADQQTAAALEAAVEIQNRENEKDYEDISPTSVGGKGVSPFAHLEKTRFGIDDPNIDEPERRRRQKAWSEYLTEKGRERLDPVDRSTAFEARHDRSVRNPVPGVSYDTIPKPLAKPVEAVTGRVVETPIIGEKVNPWQMLYGKKDSLRSKAVKSVGDVRRAAGQTTPGYKRKGLQYKGTDLPEVKARKKREAETKDLFKLYSAAHRLDKKEGTPETNVKKYIGQRISLPKGKFLGSGRYRTLSKKSEKYKEFYGNLRKHTQQLVNNKDAGKDAAIRIARIKKGLAGGKMSREELADEVRVLKMIGRSASVSKPFFLHRNSGKVWKDFLSKDLGELTDRHGLFGDQFRHPSVSPEALIDELKDAGF